MKQQGRRKAHSTRYYSANNTTYMPFSDGLSLTEATEYNNEINAWTLLKTRSAKNNLKIPIWSAYNSLLSKAMVKFTYTALPVLHGSPTDTSNLFTTLKIAQGISVSIASDLLSH